MIGSGIYSDPYLIGSQGDLEAIGDNPDAVYELVADIELTGTLTPLPAFSGWLKGEGHKISNLTVAVSSGFYGLFERIVDGGRVSDLEIITSDSGVSSSNTDQPGGVLAGLIIFDGSEVAPTVERVTLRGKISPGKGAGGLAGFIYNVTGTGSKKPAVRESAVFVEVLTGSGKDDGILFSNASGGVVIETVVVSSELAGVSILSGINSNVTGTPKDLTIAEIGNSSLYPAYWDFGRVWEMFEGYPRLKRAEGQATTQSAKVSGIVQVDSSPAQRQVRAYGYNPIVHEIDGSTVTLSKSLGHATSDPTTGEYTIDLLGGYGNQIFVVAFDDYGDEFTPDKAISVGDRIHPSEPNGYVFECTGSGTLPSEEPTWITDTETSQLYGTASMIARVFYRPMVHGPIAPVVSTALWTPAAMFESGELGVWYDPSDLSTMYQDTGKTLAVTGNGQPVGYIADKSGNGRHAIQSNDARRPIYRTDGTRHWLEFDGANHYLSFSGLSFPSTYMIGLACQYSDTATQRIIVGHSADSSKLGVVSSARDMFFRAVHGGTAIDVDVTDHAGLDRVWTAYRDASDGAVGRLKGAEVGATAGNVGSARFDTFGGTIYNATIDLFFKGNMYGLAIAENHALNSSLKYEGYISHKLNLAGDLPSDHPYKSAPPTSETWTPIELFSNSELGAWYDPSDLTTMFQDAAGTTPVTADGDPVGLIHDKSGNEYHAFQSDLAKQPVYRTDGTLHWLEFSGSQRLTIQPLNIGPDWSALSAYSFNTVATQSIFDGDDTDSDPQNRIAQFIRTSSSGAPQSVAFDDSSAYGVFSPDPMTVGQAFTQSGRVLSGEIEVFVNSQLKSSDTMSGTPAQGSIGPVIGSRVASGADLRHFDGNLFGLIFLLDEAVTDSDRIDSESWLAAKAGLT